MSTLIIRKKGTISKPSKNNRKAITVTDRTYEKIKELSRETNTSIRELSEVLILYAMKNIKIEE